MKITYFGTTTLLFDDGTDQILFDAHISRPSLRKALFGRLSTDTRTADDIITQYGFDRLRAIFISHSHYDHVLDAPYFARVCGADVYGSPSALNVARGGGIPEARLHGYDTQTKYTVGRFNITVIPSIHSKAHWYNDDLGQTIDVPLQQPAPKRAFKEGGSFDFLVQHEEKSFLIRPSFNCIPGQLDGIRADVLFLGTAGLAKASKAEKALFFSETIEKVRPALVIPVHWDHFFKPLNTSSLRMLPFVEKTEDAMFELAQYCGAHGVSCAVQLPMTSLTL